MLLFDGKITEILLLLRVSTLDLDLHMSIYLYQYIFIQNILLSHNGIDLGYTTYNFKPFQPKMT